jgi:4a-hydroxytetrahydrobiopterin dehydratase
MKINKDKLEDFCIKNNWILKSESLYKCFVLYDFKMAINYINQIAQIAEDNNHHPKIVNSYSKVEIYWRTNDLKAITAIDIKLAEMCETTYNKLNAK